MTAGLDLSPGGSCNVRPPVSRDPQPDPGLRSLPYRRCHNSHKPNTRSSTTNISAHTHLTGLGFSLIGLRMLWFSTEVNKTTGGGDWARPPTRLPRRHNIRSPFSRSDSRSCPTPGLHGNLPSASITPSPPLPGSAASCQRVGSGRMRVPRLLSARSTAGFAPSRAGREVFSFTEGVPS